MNNIVTRSGADAALMSLMMLKMCHPDMNVVAAVNLAPDDPKAVGWAVWESATEHCDDAVVRLYVALHTHVEQDVCQLARIIRQEIIA